MAHPPRTFYFIDMNSTNITLFLYGGFIKDIPVCLVFGYKGALIHEIFLGGIKVYLVFSPPFDTFLFGLIRVSSPPFYLIFFSGGEILFEHSSG